jgi:hypothetical protein
MRHSLYKFYSERRWAEKFLDGEVLFRSLSYFRDYEDQVRGDRNEGTAIFRPEGGLVIHNLTQDTKIILPRHTFESSTSHNEIFVFCLSRSFTEPLAKEFDAAACIEVRNIRAFCARIKEALPPEATFFGKRVEYYRITEGATPRWALPEKIATSKLDSFARQNEFRLVFSLTDALAFEKVRTRLVEEHVRDTARDVHHAKYPVRARDLRDICQLHDLK